MSTGSPCGDIRFVSYKSGQDLAHYIAAADIFVFPGKTDTFGIVMLEAMACNTPVDAYPVTGCLPQPRPGADCPVCAGT